MIISKAALQLSILMTEDTGPLSFLCVEPDGRVLAGNGEMMAAVSGTDPEVLRKVPLDDIPGDGGRILLGGKTVKELVRKIPADKQFKGLLEHVALGSVTDEYELGAMRNKCMVRYTNGQSTTEEMVPRKVGTEWIDYRSMFSANLSGTSLVEGDLKRFAVNRKRLSAAIAAIDKVCAYDGRFAITGLEFKSIGTIVFRAFHELLGLKMILVTMGEPNPAEWFKDWESFEASVGRKIGARKIL